MIFGNSEPTRKVDISQIENERSEKRVYLVWIPKQSVEEILLRPAARSSYLLFVHEILASSYRVLREGRCRVMQADWDAEL